MQSHLGIPGGNNSSRPITPVEAKRSPTHGRATGRTKVTSGKKREPSVQLHPKQFSPLRVSPYHGKSPPSTSTNRYLNISYYKIEIFIFHDFILELYIHISVVQSLVLLLELYSCQLTISITENTRDMALAIR